MEEEFDFEDEDAPESPFHIEVDLYETGDYSRLLVVPCSDSYVVIYHDEHLCTLIHTCKEVECWVQEEGTLEEELAEKIGAAIKSFSAY